MDVKILKSSIKNRNSSICITGSKSESNRLLLLQALYPQISIENLSNSEDTNLMQKALQKSNSISVSNLIDIHHAGTAMRFLTAYFVVKEDCEIILTGSPRMKERPIQILVDALISLGAEITYLENEGFPPLKITGKKLTKYKVILEANVSSQYISALLLIASKLEKGLELNLKGKTTSVPYIKMTLSLLSKIGVENSFVANKIVVEPQTSNLKPQTIVVESDWSSASYWYSILALSEEGTEIKLSAYRPNSLQGDSVLAEIYKQFNVTTTFESNTITLKKSKIKNQKSLISLDLSNAPDIAQTIAVTTFGLGLACKIKGLHTLKIKETDRLVALKNELKKLGADISITTNSLYLKVSNKIENNVLINTYNDHRMAMAFVPLALKTDITIANAEVVSKSYPSFWNDIQSLGFKVREL